MKKNIQLFVMAILLATFTKAQFNWTWIGGSSNSVNQSPTFGTQGVGSTTNSPGARYGSVSWTDNAGNIWLFGGNQANLGYMSDLWRYTPSNGQWTWMKGPSSAYQYGVYGTQGTGATNNTPGCRLYSGGWADNNGNLYLFGGYGHSGSSSYVYNNDLWRYNISSNTWTWLKGSSSGYAYATPGTQGTGATNNTPGCRYFCPMSRDQSGNGWLYGGYGYSSNNQGMNNDLWKFDISTGNWIWIKGSTTNVNLFGVYGTQGVASTTNNPGCREEATLTFDNNGNLYLFGGYGYTSNNSGNPNDLWRYNIANNTWTWLKGSNTTASNYGVYGTQGTGASTNTPGGRVVYGCNQMMCDGSGNLWMFGGYGYSSNSFARLNDLWRYSPSNDQWTWMKGSSSANQFGVYGTINVANTNNTPGGKEVPIGIGANGSFYIYGGYGTNTSNTGIQDDFWRIDFCNYGTPPANTTPTANLSVCSGNTTTLTVSTASGTILWYASSSSTSNIGTGTSVVVSSSLMTASSNPTTALIYVTNSVSCGENSNRQAITVTVNPNPTLTVNNGTVCEGSVFVMNPSGAQTYSFSNGANTVVATTSQNYTVTGTNAFGCTNTITAVASLSVRPSPVIVVNSGSICAGGSFVIVPTGAVSYTYSSGSPTVFPQSSTGYMVTGTSSLGCTSASPAIASVMVYALPSIAANNATICANASYTINPTGAATYTYSNGSGVISPSVSSVYGITGTSQYGCVSNNTVLVYIHVNPRPNIVAANALICSGQTVTLQAQGASTYTYSSGSQTVAPSVTTTYSIHGTSQDGCETLVPALVTVSVNPTPVLTVNSGSMCSGNSYSLMPSGAATYTYYSGAPVVSPMNTTTYYIAGSSTSGCTSSVTPVVVTVYQSPTLMVSDGAVCAGGSYTILPAGASSYSYSNGSAVVMPTSNTQYTVTGYSTEGCEDQEVITVFVNANPVLNASAFTPTICAGESATLVVSGASSYSWNSASGGQMTTVGYIVVNPTATAVYTVIGYSNEGCEASATITQNVAECAGIQNNGLLGFNVYPNPNNGSFIINAPANANFSIMSASGQLIQAGQTTIGENTINLTNYSNGLYLVHISLGGQSHVVRIIKQ